MKRRTVQKITPSQLASFDQQFWPVLVAITVLCGIALGAVLTILRGPWMWGSLVGLPVLSVAAIFLLFHLDNKKLRRSFQFAIILSLALHLSVMVFASIVNIFGNGFERPERRVAQRPVKTIEISDQRASFVWEEVNARDTPEPEVQPEKKENLTTDVKPQPIPVKETETVVTPEPQLTRRESPQSSVPRQNRELSKLRRQTANRQPRSSQKVTGKAMEIAAQPAPSPQPKVEVTESSSKADAVAKSAPKEPEVAEPMKNTDAAPAAKPEPEVAVASAATRRSRVADTTAMSMPSPSSSTARIRRTQPMLPIETSSAPPNETKVAKASTPQPTIEAAKSSGELTRRPVESDVTRPSRVAATQPRLSPQTQLARAAERRSNERTQPSISNPVSVTTDARRSTADAAVATSSIPIEQPTRSPTSNKASREVSSKTLSVAKSTDGVVGIGRAKNLDRFVGGEPTPAVRASDSARRERTLSQPSEASMLTASTAAKTRRASGSLKLPTSAFKADTSAPAKITGSVNPSERSMESSAAQITSASTSHRDEVSAERGSSSVDLGPTKIVNDEQRSRRLSGGGQMEISKLSPNPTRRSRDRSDEQPTLAAAEGLEVAAPRKLSAVPSSAESIDASSEAVVESRTGGQAVVSADRASAAETGAISDLGETNMKSQLADKRERSTSDQRESGFAISNDRETENDNSVGQRKSRIAQSPVTRDTPGFGIARSDGRAENSPENPGDELSESKSTEVAKQSTAAAPGAGVAPLASQLESDTVAASPSMDRPTSERRDARASSNQASSSMEIELAERKASLRESSDVKLDVKPGPMGELVADSGKSNVADESVSPTTEARAVDIDRVALDASEQVQGMELKVLAMEGPAGLGDRPDEFIGVLARPASRDSEQIMPDMENRFRNREFGGVPAMNPDAVIAKDAFRNRSPASMSKTADPTTEAAIQLGLEFLARYQSPDGSWSLTGFDREAAQYLTQLDSDTAATGLAVLAFQGAGFNHREYKYAKQLEKAIDWLVENQADDGGLYVPTDKKSNDACRLYSHGIATLALTEAYGMTQDPQLEKPAQKALDYIAACQDDVKGGWRYFDQPGKRSADTSVSGWMMMALQSGRLAGLDVKRTAFDGVDDWLDVAADPENASLYRYNPYAVDAKGVSRVQGRRPSASMTSVGLLMRIYAGWKKDDPRLLAGADYLLNTQMPSDSTPQLRDTYYWYYATQVLKHVDGPHWEQWNNQLRPLLTRSQEKTGDMAGSWHPYRPVPDRWGSFGGRLYVTSMNLLSLEVRHRLLPIYQQGEDPKLMGIIETGELIAMSEEEAELPTVVGTLEVPSGNRKETLVPSVVASANADSDASPGDGLPPAVAMNLNSNTGARIETSTTDPQTDFENEANSPDPVTKPEVAIEIVDVAPMLPEAAVERDSLAIDIADVFEPDATGRVAERLSMNRKVPAMEQTSPVIGSVAVSEVNEPLEPRMIAAADEGQLSQRRGSSVANAKSVVSMVERGERRADRSGITRPRRKVLKPSIGGDAIQLSAKELALIAEAKAVPDAKLPLKMPADSVAQVKPEPPKVVYGAIAGKVMLDGEVLGNARVEFIPLEKQGTRMVARTNRLGQYSITEKNTQNGKGMVSGEYRISVTTTKETPDVDVIDLLEVVPDKYNTSTTLKATIKPSSITTFDLQLESEFISDK